MSSKKDPEAGVHQRPWSLATRLTVIYALSAFAAVSMASIILYVGLVRNLEEEDDQFLEERAHELQSMVTRGSDSLRELKSQIEAESIGERSPQIYTRVFQPGSGASIETHGMAQELPTALFPEPGRDSNDPMIVEIHSAQGRSYRVSQLMPLQTQTW